MKLTSMFEFAFGKEVNSGKEINPNSYTASFSYYRDVEGYGLAIRHGIDANLSEAKGFTINIEPSQIPNGYIEFKTEASGNTPESKTSIFREMYGSFYPIPVLSSPLKEIVFWFPKKDNMHAGRMPLKIKNIIVE